MITVKKELDEIDKQIIQLAGEGKTAKETASKMNLSINQVTGRIKAMMQYYSCANKTSLVEKLSNLAE